MHTLWLFPFLFTLLMNNSTFAIPESEHLIAENYFEEGTYLVDDAAKISYGDTNGKIISLPFKPLVSAEEAIAFYKDIFGNEKVNLLIVLHGQAEIARAALALYELMLREIAVEESAPFTKKQAPFQLVPGPNSCNSQLCISLDNVLKARINNHAEQAKVAQSYRYKLSGRK